MSTKIIDSILKVIAVPMWIWFLETKKMKLMDMYGTPGPSGMYIVVMQASEFMDTKKVILLK